MTIYAPLTSAVEFLRQSFQRRVGDGTLAYLGNGSGRVDVIGRPDHVYIRYPGVPDASGNATFSTPGIARSTTVPYLVQEGAPVYVGIGYSGELEIIGAHYPSLSQAGVNSATFNPLNPQSRWVYLWQLTIGLCSAVATTTSNSFLVTIKKFRYYSGNRFQTFETGLQADKIDLTSYIPAVDTHRYAAVWTDTYGNVAEVTTSTTQSLFTPLDSTDIQETVANRPPDAVPHKAFYLSNNQGTITQQAASDVDLRQFMNMPQLHGFTSPVSYRERIQPGRQVLVAGSLKVTKSLQVLGELVVIPPLGSGGSGGSGITTVKEDGATIVSSAISLDFKDMNVEDLGSGAAAIYLNLTGIVDGRITLGTGDPVSDSSGSATLYYTPYLGNRIALYDGTRWKVYTFTERSIAVPNTTGTNYDVFLYDNAGTLTLELVAWSNNTTRATGIVRQDGVYVKSGATTRRYLGTVRTSPDSGVIKDRPGGSGTTLAERYVWNYYNRVPRAMFRNDLTDSWTYATASWRAANNDATNIVNFVIGVQEDAVICNVVGRIRVETTEVGAVGIGLDSTTANSANLFAEAGQTGATAIGNAVIARYNGYAGIGYHYLSWIEYARSGTVDFYGDNGVVTVQTGIHAEILA